MNRINGNIKKRVTITKNIETIIYFVDDIRSISLRVSGGYILFKFNGNIEDIDDITANKLENGEGFDTIKSGPIKEIHVLTDEEDVELQWDIP